MRSAISLRPVLVWAAVLGFCLPQPVLAAGSTPRVVDVELSRGGELLGQLVDRQGTAMAKQSVTVSSGDRRIAVARTDSSGHFTVVGLRGGVYQVTAADSQTTFRLWAPGSAPPLSKAGILLVGGRETVRGQVPGLGGLKFWLSNPWVLTGAAAVAVAVPIIIHNAQRPSSP